MGARAGALAYIEDGPPDPGWDRRRKEPHLTPTVRWILIVVGFAGILLSAAGVADSIQVFRTNGVTHGDPIGLREHYLQLGSFYNRGFTTGFFFCFSLMLVAIAVGTLYDDRRRVRKLAASAHGRALLAGENPPVAGL